MKVEQRRWMESKRWEGAANLGSSADVVFVFGSTGAFREQAWIESLRRDYPTASLVGCSTAGEVLDTRLYDDSVVSTAVSFGTSTIRIAQVDLHETSSSRDAGEKLAARLEHAHLRHVFVLSDGLHVNGSELAAGLAAKLPSMVQVTGGLAADGPRFESTLVLGGDRAMENQIVAVGFYGEKLRVGFGSVGGWDTFGPLRRITRAKGSVLYELDHKPALQLYKNYLGEHAAQLPSSGLLFPLNIQRPGQARTVVRTILSVDEATQSLTFAGDVPEGSSAQLMKVNFDRLIDGAANAATASHPLRLLGSPPDLALLISCVGRRLVLKQRTEEELEGVRDVLGVGTAMTGFYSYGEICPAAPDANCELHNQTMTITTFWEES